jgi:HEAT repeat protein
MMTARHLISLLLIMPPLAWAAPTRAPEPMPSAAAQMFLQLETGDWRNWIEKAEALEYLSRYDVPNAKPAVQKILDDKHPNNRWLRGQAVIAMARIDPGNAAALAKAHAQDPHVEVRIAVAQVCADLTKDQATPILEKLFVDKTPAIQFTALAAYARHHGEKAWSRAEAITAKIPDNAIQPAVRALAWIGTDPALARLREHIVQGKHTLKILSGLRGVTNPALAPVYLDLLASSNDITLQAGVWAELEHFDRKAVLAACQSALASGDQKNIQAVSRLVASHLREPTLGDALKAALAKSEDLTTRLLGLSALSCVDADRFSAYFISHLSHKDPKIRITAVNCLAQCKDVNLYETFEKTLAEENSGVRVSALKALRHAAEEHVPEDRIIDYFTPSLLSPDQATRGAAIDTMVPFIHLDNAQVALELMLKMQSTHGTSGTEPLMHIVFRLVEPEKAAPVLQGHGYVAHWHVMGAFPSGFGAPKEDVDGFAFAYPPEKEVDLTKRYQIQYNVKNDNRFGKEVGEVEVGWVQATIGNADGVLFMTKGGRSQLQMPRRNGVCYAYTELVVSEKAQVTMTFLLNMRAQVRVWLNGKVVGLTSKADKKQGTATKTATVTLPAGKNRLLVKVASNDHSGAWWAPKVSTRGFALRLTDKDGNPVKWSHE